MSTMEIIVENDKQIRTIIIQLKKEFEDAESRYEAEEKLVLTQYEEKQKRTSMILAEIVQGLAKLTTEPSPKPRI